MRLAVAMCTKDGERHVAAQLRSILEQSRPPDEVVVCDDASSDGTVDVVQEVVAAHAVPVRVVRNARTLGVIANFDQAIQLVDGDVVVLADQDDQWAPHRLARLESELRDTSVAAVFSDAVLIDDGDRPTGARLWAAQGVRRAERRELETGRALDVLLRRNVVTGATLAFRAELREVVCPLPPHVMHDYAIAVVAATLGGLTAIEEPLLSYRVHDGSTVGVPPTAPGALATRRRGDADARTEERALVAALLPRLELAGAAPAALRLLRSKVDFLEQRAALASDPVHRLAPVARAVAHGRYRRLANGWRSAVHDLAFGA